MCVADWKVGRFIRSFSRNQLVDTNSLQILAPNSNRVGIMFGVPPLNMVGLSTIQGQNTAPGFMQHTDSEPILITLQHHGDLPTKEWFAISIGNSALLVVEFVLPEEVLQADLDKIGHLNR